VLFVENAFSFHHEILLPLKPVILLKKDLRPRGMDQGLRDQKKVLGEKRNRNLTLIQH